MPSRPLRPCATRGCRGLTREGRYCDRCAAQPQREERGTSHERGYGWDWQQVAEQRRVLDKGLCQECLREGNLVPSRLVDHIVPVDVRPDWRLELGNTQVLCTTHNTAKGFRDKEKYASAAERDKARSMTSPPNVYRGDAD